jgi:hypothetical protein
MLPPLGACVGSSALTSFVTKSCKPNTNTLQSVYACMAPGKVVRHSSATAVTPTQSCEYMWFTCSLDELGYNANVKVHTASVQLLRSNQ